MNKGRLVILEKLSGNFKQYPGNTAFFIKDESFTYRDLEKRISAIQDLILSKVPSEIKYIGILGHDSLDTYASIFAVLYSGKAFVPLNPLNPAERNQEIIRQMNLGFILGQGETAGIAVESFPLLLNTKSQADNNREILLLETLPGTDVYVLFTSGSTGKPKGVRINRQNLDSFYNSYISFGPEYNKEDRFLQVYDISFDGSVPCYMVALAAGASVYTVPQDEIKYLYALKLMKEHELTVVKMTPSILYLLRPFMDRINLPSVRCSIFGGEALPAGITGEWMACVPNSLVQNAYGPTEATIDSLMYNVNQGDMPVKSHGGIVSLGRSFGDFEYAVVNSSGERVQDPETGELCLSGSQVMVSYWNDDQKTGNAFLSLETVTGKKKFYRTGDLVFRDGDGFFMFCGRIDNQVQIQGYRVELTEIEKHAKDFLGEVNLAAVAGRNSNGNTEIVLFTGQEKLTAEPVISYLEGVLPYYMIPSRIEYLDEWPQQVSGKTDRIVLSAKADRYEEPRRT